jgi:hypothetical protein
MATGAKRLSFDQKDLLRVLLGHYQHTEAHGSSLDRDLLGHWGIRLTCLRPRGLSRSRYASITRTLARLEKRGLIIRTKDVSEGHRTTCIKLTDLGRQVARTC